MQSHDATPLKAVMNSDILVVILPTQESDLSLANASEQDKIKAMIFQSTEQYDPSK